MSDLRVGFVRVFVSDFVRAFEFYTKSVGMRKDYSDGANWAQFHAGNDISLCIERAEKGDAVIGRITGITLLTDNIGKAFEELKARGVEFTVLPSKQPWGGLIAAFRDPDGNVLTLMQSSED